MTTEGVQFMTSGKIVPEPALTDSEARFEPIRRRADCRYCNETIAFASLPPPVDAVICVSTQD
jgi:hypothetical protein